jgi:hypothetical protein
MYKNEGLCPRRDEKKNKKKENSRKINCKLYSKTKLKKRGTAESEARYRPRRYSSTPPTIGGTVLSGLTSFPKKKKFKTEKEVARRTRTQKIKK